MVSTVVIRFCQSRRKLHILWSSLGEGLRGTNDEFRRLSRVIVLYFVVVMVSLK